MDRRVPGESSAESGNQRQPGARFALLLCTSIYFLSFVDRIAPQSVKQEIIDDFHLKDAQSTLPTLCGTAIYPFSAILTGWIVDKGIVQRRTFLCVALVAWSAATSFTALAQDLTQLIFLRMLVYAGEASFAVIAFPLLADYYPKSELPAVYGIMMFGMPTGVAAGFGAGGAMGSLFGWRAALCLCGIPGLVLACLVPRMTLPPKRANDERTDGSQVRTFRSELRDYYEIVSQKHWMVAAIGGVLLTAGLSIGGEWTTIFYIRIAGTSLAEANAVMSLRTLIGAGLGTLCFSRLTQAYSAQVHNVNFFVMAVFMLPAVAFTFIEINSPEHKLIMFPSAFAASFFQYCFNGPLTALMMAAIRPELRGRAYSVWSVLQRGFDMFAPLTAGIVSDHVGLRRAMQIVWMLFLASDVFWWVGYMLPPMAAPPTEQEAATTYSSLLCNDGEKARLQTERLKASKEGYGSVP